MDYSLSYCKRGGRPAYDVTVFGAGGRQPLDEVAVEQFQAAGADRIIFVPPPSAEDRIAPELKRAGELAKRYE